MSLHSQNYPNVNRQYADIKYYIFTIALMYVKYLVITQFKYMIKTIEYYIKQNYNKLEK
jgi:hypothetical protein